MSYEPVEGYDYIIDRYAVLNGMMEDAGHEDRIDSSSETAALKRVIKLARALHHPEKQLHAGQENIKKAEQQTALIVECERILLHENLKAAYDLKLQVFLDEKPQRVSKNGAIIIDVSAPIFDLDSLLSSDAPDFSAKEKNIKGMSGYDEAAFKNTETLYQSMPNNEQIKALYKEALSKKLTYLTLLEDLAWAEIGVINRRSKVDGMLMHCDDYAQNVNAAIEGVVTRDIPNAVSGRTDAVRMGLAGPSRLLLTFQGAAVGVDDAQGQALSLEGQAEEMINLAEKHLRDRSAYALDLAQQKQDVLEKLVEFTTVELVSEHDPESPLYDVYLVDPREGGDVVLLKIELDASRGASEMGEFDSGMLLETLRKGNLKANSYVVIRNPAITDFMIEISNTVGRLAYEYQQCLNVGVSANAEGQNLTTLQP